MPHQRHPQPHPAKPRLDHHPRNHPHLPIQLHRRRPPPHPPIPPPPHAARPPPTPQPPPIPHSTPAPPARRSIPQCRPPGATFRIRQFNTGKHSTSPPANCAPRPTSFHFAFCIPHFAFPPYTAR